MDQPFRFSLYLRRLGQHWRLILLPALIALVVAILLSFLIPVRYTAKTTVAAPKPQQVWRWDNKLYDIVDVRFDWRAEVMPLVKTRKVAQLALTQVQDQLSRSYTPEEVIAATSVKPGAGALFTISVKAADAKDAALLANALANALPDAVADIYAGKKEAFTDAEADVRQKFEMWDQKWRAFEAQYGIGLGFTGDLASLGDQQLYGNQSAIKQTLTLKSSDVASLTNFQDKVTLVQAALNNQEAASHLAILDTPELARYGLDFTTLQRLPPAELKKTINDLAVQVAADVAAMNVDLLDKQKEVTELLKTREDVQGTRNLWHDAIVTLQNKQIELEVKRVLEGQRVHQVDAAQVPTHPSQPNWALNLSLALVAGLMGGLFLAVIAVYLGGESDWQA